ncbi:hypothetical protein E1B28_010797 [Marasmius oreades]|uniref:Uncharacterized protein n=1 Tax=Marasmius oreades TaxID=181124 RepID=A0A9P7UPB7_9AGAR|nr:uncharacterized protein E1B28_010797 [Marasmius oreades]KAG7089088.1 hypothetical protein E1B28_010797 [Marasmius oreades]
MKGRFPQPRNQFLAGFAHCWPLTNDVNFAQRSAKVNDTPPLDLRSLLIVRSRESGAGWERFLGTRRQYTTAVEDDKVLGELGLHLLLRMDAESTKPIPNSQGKESSEEQEANVSAEDTGNEAGPSHEKGISASVSAGSDLWDNLRLHGETGTFRKAVDK